MRTVWLALFCVICVATAAVLKVGMSPDTIADASRGTASSTRAHGLQETVPSADANPPSAAGTIATNIQNRILMKSDKLELSYREEVKPVQSIAIAPTEMEPTLSNRTERVVSWHWHDPLDKRTAGRSIKYKLPSAGAKSLGIASARVSKP